MTKPNKETVPGWQIQRFHSQMVNHQNDLHTWYDVEVDLTDGRRVRGVHFKSEDDKIDSVLTINEVLPNQ